MNDTEKALWKYRGALRSLPIGSKWTFLRVAQLRDTLAEMHDHLKPLVEEIGYGVKTTGLEPHEEVAMDVVNYSYDIPDCSFKFLTNADADDLSMVSSTCLEVMDDWAKSVVADHNRLKTGGREWLLGQWGPEPVKS